MTVKGYVPDKIAIVVGSERVYKMPYRNDVTAKQSYVCEVSTTSIRTRIGWAKNDRLQWSEDHRTRLSLAGPVIVRIVDNEPISNVRLFNNRPDERSCGVIVNDEFIFQMHEDVLFESIEKFGVVPGGVLYREYIIAKYNGCCKLIRVDSDLYNELTESTVRKKTKKLKDTDLNIGDVLVNKSGTISVYLGHVDTCRADVERRNGVDKYTLHEVKNNSLWATLGSFGAVQKTYSYQSKFDDLVYEISKYSRFRYSLKQRHDYIKKIDYVSVDADLIKNIRTAAVALATKSLSSGQQSHANNNSWLHSQDQQKFDPGYYLRHHLESAFLRESGSSFEPDPIYKEFYDSLKATM